jgi:hypothetical protein
MAKYPKDENTGKTSKDILLHDRENTPASAFNVRHGHIVMTYLQRHINFIIPTKWQFNEGAIALIVHAAIRKEKNCVLFSLLDLIRTF